MGELGCEPWWPGPQSRFNHSVMYVWGKLKQSEKAFYLLPYPHLCQPTAYVTSISICTLGPISVANSRTWFQHLSHCLIISYFFSLIFLTGCTHISCSHVLLHLSLGKKYLPWSHSSLQLPPYFPPLIYSTVFQKGDLYLSSTSSVLLQLDFRGFPYPQHTHILIRIVLILCFLHGQLQWSMLESHPSLLISSICLTLIASLRNFQAPLCLGRVFSRYWPSALFSLLGCSHSSPCFLKHWRALGLFVRFLLFL